MKLGKKLILTTLCTVLLPFVIVTTYYVTSGGNPAYAGLTSFNNANPNAKLKSIAKRNYWQYLVGNNFTADARTIE